MPEPVSAGIRHLTERVTAPDKRRISGPFSVAPQRG
jgi:hypothetical protein